MASQILTVCTGNICRSPYLERSLAVALDGKDYVVRSAGTRALVGHPIEPGSLDLLQRKGIDDGGFRSRQLTPEMIAGADLILTATRGHRAEVAQMNPKGLKYTFAVADFSDLVAGVTQVPESKGSFFGPADDSYLGRLVDFTGQRRTSIHPRGEDEADIVDPFRRAPQVFEQMARQIEAVLPSIVRALLLES
ncbi:arsenate reductase/protein-tyrosine-phosphatase family protein [Calidifontibacter terrae]